MILKNSIFIDNEKIFLDVCGVNNKNLKRIENISSVYITSAGNEIQIEGKDAEIVEKLILSLIDISRRDGHIYTSIIDMMYDELRNNNDIDFKEMIESGIELSKINKIINPRSINQSALIQLLKTKDVVFSYGPAGTGKTFLCIAHALNLLINKDISKIILTRPIVEAGESLGFLPGDFMQKINPYLIPLFDAITQIVPSELYLKMNTRNMIEVAPLAYMRGRTFENCAVILDEAQNTTTSQMKMFLTRLGNNAKLFITGDITQIDLPSRVRSGMVEALEILRGVKEIGFLQFEEKDVVRHPIVKKIINAYNGYEKK